MLITTTNTHSQIDTIDGSLRQSETRSTKDKISLLERKKGL